MLALWEYFWTWSGTPPAVATPDPTTPGRGSGKGKDDDYQLMPDEFWEERAKRFKKDKRKPVFEAPTQDELDNIEQQLTRKKQQVFADAITEILTLQQQLASMQQELDSSHEAMRAAKSIDELKMHAKRIRDLPKAMASTQAALDAAINRATKIRESLQ